MKDLMSFEILKNASHDDVPAMLLWLLLIALFLLIIYVLACWIPAKRRERLKKEKAQKQPKVKKEKVKKVKQPKVVETKSEETTPTQNEESQGHSSEYISPLILDRQKYEIALQEKLEREKQEKLNRQAAETARLEALKNKEFQSRAGFISTLQRFSKKEALEKQISDEGKVDRELLDSYLNEKGTTISEEFTNMSPELKAVVLSDLLKRKY